MTTMTKRKRITKADAVEMKRAAVAYERKVCETPARVFAQCRMSKPAKEHKHLFGIRDIKGKRYGYFLVANVERHLDRAALREIFAEAKEEGVNTDLCIYGATCSYFGRGINFIQIGWDE